MIDLTTNYLGLRLHNPVVCSASPLSQDLGAVARMEEAGAAAIVLHSLFEEQIELECLDLGRCLDSGTESYAEALSYFPDMGAYNLGPEGYLEHLRAVKALVRVPIIASLNGRTRGGWTHFARLMEEAGADALELNVYEVPTSLERASTQVEDDLVALVRDVVRLVEIPVAVKLSPFYTAPAALARRLDEAGAKGLVLFNRFYQPDFDLEHLEVVPSLTLSTADELRLRLHWAAILAGRIQADLAVTGGVHTARDVLKSLMAGANVAMMTAALFRHGIEHIAQVLSELRDWMADHEYPSVEMMRGSMSFRAVPDPAAYERANYLKVLRSHALFPPEG